MIGLVVWDWGDWWVRGFLWFNCGWINFLSCKLGGVNIFWSWSMMVVLWGQIFEGVVDFAVDFGSSSIGRLRGAVIWGLILE